LLRDRHSDVGLIHGFRHFFLTPALPRSGFRWRMACAQGNSARLTPATRVESGVITERPGAPQTLARTLFCVIAMALSLAAALLLPDVASAGESHEAPRLVALSFRVSEDKPLETFRVALRPAEEMRLWLKLSRLGLGSSSGDYAVRVAGATDHDLSDARRAALATLEALNHENPAGALNSPERAVWNAKWFAQRTAALRILSVAGELEDVSLIIDRMIPAASLIDTATWLFAIGLIEARHDSLVGGRLAALTQNPNVALAFQAARTMRRFGLNNGIEVLRDTVIKGKSSYEKTTAAELLAGDPGPATLSAMRELADAILADPVSARGKPGMLLWPALHLLAFGDTEDLRRVEGFPFARRQAADLAVLAENPRELIEYALGGMTFREAARVVDSFRDRGQAEYLELEDWLLETAGTKASASKEEWDQDKAYFTALNTLRFLQSAWIPHRDVVCIWKGWNRMEKADADWAASNGVTWMAFPDSLEALIEQWFGGNTIALALLEFHDLAEIDDVVSRRGDGKTPPGYEMYRSYRRVAHRSRIADEPFAMGQKRWPFVLAYREKTPTGEEEFGGGISGVATAVAEWDGKKRLVVRIRLDRQAHYEGGGAMFGIGDRSSATEYPHHVYMQNRGRQLIQRVGIRRGTTKFEARDTARVEDGWMVFEAMLSDSSLADLYLDIDMKFIDQPFTLSEPLFVGSLANTMRGALETKAASQPTSATAERP
jgi:hypothetical protein